MTESMSLIIETSRLRNRRLGRHVHFDDRSLAFLAPKGTGAVTSRLWARTIPAFQQGSFGSCTGNGSVGLLATEPFFKPGSVVDEVLSRAVYSRATALDSIRGGFPPDDTGSTVLAAGKALVAMGLATSYVWCLGLDHVLQTLSNVGPVAVGVSWHTGFDYPSARGLVHLSGKIEGGHCFELLGIDVEKQEVIAINSWGSSWGVKGRFRIRWADLDKLLKDDGEAMTITTA